MSLRVDPVIFTDTFTSFSPFPNTHNSGVRGPVALFCRQSGVRHKAPREGRRMERV